MSRVTVNPKAKCPKCGTFMTFVGKTRAWGNKYKCSKCGYKRFTKAVKPWQRVTEANLIGGNPMAKKKRTRRPRQMKVLGIPVMMVAVIGGLAWWMMTRTR